MNSPEAIVVIKQHLIDREVCIRCNTCEESCPVDAITHDSRNFVVNADICNACISPCPTGVMGTPLLPLLEGQSVGIVPPGVDVNGKPHCLRMYSVAGPRTGEREGYNSLSLTVKRVTHDRDGKPTSGVGSVYLCGLKGMETGVLDALQHACTLTGLHWPALHQRLVEEGRFHVETC